MGRRGGGIHPPDGDRRLGESGRHRVSAPGPAWRGAIGRGGHGGSPSSASCSPRRHWSWVSLVARRSSPTGVSLVVLVAAAVVDVAEHRLPNALVGLAAASRSCWRCSAAGSADLLRSSRRRRRLLGGPLLVTHLVSPAGMGFGDVKAGAVLGAALGLLDPQIALLALVLGLAAAASWGLGQAIPVRGRSAPAWSPARCWPW